MNIFTVIPIKFGNLTHRKRSVLRAKILYVKALAARGFRKKVILCYPKRPDGWHALYHITHVLGLQMSNDPHKTFDVCIAFLDTTKRPEDATLRDLEQKTRVINARCGDISKVRVEEIFKKVFGYGMAVDPRNFNGPYVKKSDINGQHSGQLQQAHAEPEEGYIYQRLINNRYENDLATIRTMIFDGTIPFTNYRIRTMSDRFDVVRHALWVDTDQAFSKDEQEKILQFCKEFGLDYGELDILRDADDGKIYIVDVNNTPAVQRKGKDLPNAVYARYLQTLSASFEKAFLKK